MQGERVLRRARRRGTGGWLQAYTLHACRCKSAQGRGVQQRGDARAAGGGEARALEIAGSRARAREAGARAGERLVP